MAMSPACTLLHLGPGLANGLANIHNAGRASTPMINIVGDHATYHRRYDAPLTSDIEGAARPFSHWVRTSASAAEVSRDAAEAVAAASTPPGRIATLILPADTAWNEADGIAAVPPAPPRPRVQTEAVANAARVLRESKRVLILVGGAALYEGPLATAGQIAAATGAALMAGTFNARIERGAGRVFVDRVPYVVDLALKRLAGFEHVILAGAKPPVAFFAYPDKPSLLTPSNCEIHVLAKPDEDVVQALDWLADEVGARRIRAPVQAPERPGLPQGALAPETLGAALAALLPENAIVVDESVSSGRGFFPATRGAGPHDWLANMGGSIGLGLPLATGAALACPGRKVICLEGDGSGMYTPQALWTQAREGLDVTTVVLANRSYAILRSELANVGAQNPGRKALDLLDLRQPDLDWIALARGMGVEAARAATLDEFIRAFRAGIATPGPYLIEVVL
jgi:acetolactate synthase-1/2/3 large subunit